MVQCVRGNPDYGKNDFADNGDGTITDKATGLMWAQADSGKGLDWQEALAWAQQMNAENYLGHNDWRLPDVKELQSIIDYTRSPDTTQSAAIDPLFTCTQITNEAGAARLPLLLDQHHPRRRRWPGGHGRLHGLRPGDGIHGARMLRGGPAGARPAGAPADCRVHRRRASGWTCMAPGRSAPIPRWATRPSSPTGAVPRVTPSASTTTCGW